MTCWYWYVATSQWPLPPEVGIKFLTGKMYGAHLRWTEVAPNNTNAHFRQAQEVYRNHFFFCIKCPADLSSHLYSLHH